MRQNLLPRLGAGTRRRLIQGSGAVRGWWPPAWDARPARAVLAASLALSLALPLIGPAPDTAQAAVNPVSSSLAVAAQDQDNPDAASPGVADPNAGSPATPDPDAPRLNASDGLVHLGLIPGANEARFIMNIRTLGQPPRKSACATRDVTGEIVLTPEGAVVSDMSKVTADMRTLHCQPPLRDNMAQSLLETQKYPYAIFTFEQATGLTVPLPTGDTTLQFIGQQFVHGVTRPAEYTTAANFAGSDMTGHASTDYKMTTFNLKPPSIGPLLQVEDDMTVEFDFRASVSGAPTAGLPPANSPAE